MKLPMDACCRTGWTGEHGLPRARLAELAGRFAAVQEEVRRRRGAGEYGFYELVDQGATVRQITTFAEGLGQAYDHVLVLGIGGSALGTKALLNALRRPAWNEWDDEGREFYPRAHRPGERGPDDGGRGAGPHRSAARPGQRDQQVRRHRGDHGAVPGGARVAGAGAGRRGLASPGVHHRSGAGRAAGAGGRATRSRRWTCRPRSAGASACSPRWASCRRRWSASTSTALLAGARRAVERAESRRSAAAIRPRCTPRCTGPPTPSSAPGSTCSCRTPTGSASSPSGTGSSGPRAWASGWTARARTVHVGPHTGGRRRRDRPAQPGAALHGGAVRQGHHLRDGGAVR